MVFLPSILALKRGTVSADAMSPAGRSAIVQPGTLGLSAQDNRLVAHVERELRILLVDDHLVFAQALEVVLSLERDIKVLGIITDGIRAVETAEREVPDVVLLDYHLPSLNGIGVLRKIREQHPDTKVVLLTSETSDEIVLDAIEAGASGYLSKNQAVREVVAAVRAAADGEVVVPPARLPSLLAGLRRREQTKVDNVAQYGITTRELDVLKCLSEGMDNQQIADQLVISPNTVRTHIQNLFAKLSAHSKAELIVIALRQGLVPPPRASGSSTGD